MDPPHACLTSSLAALQPGGPMPEPFNGSSRAVPAFKATWPDGVQFLPSLTACGQPVLITNTVASRWPAAQRWSDPGYVERLLPKLTDAYVLDRDEADSLGRFAATSDDDGGEGGDGGDGSGACEASVAAAAAEEAEEEMQGVEFAPDPSGEAVASLPTTELRASAEEPPKVVYFARWMGFEALASLRADASPHLPLTTDPAGSGAER